MFNFPHFTFISFPHSLQHRKFVLSLLITFFHEVYKQVLE